MEKRAFTRQLLHHQAQYSSPQKNPSPCIIKDFCKTGLFVTVEDNQHKLRAGDTLFIDFKSSGALQLNYRLHVRIVRVVDGAMGLEITHSNPEAIHVLYKLSKEPAVTQQRKSSGNYEHLHGKLTNFIDGFAAFSNRHLFGQIENALMEKAKFAPDNAQETVYADAATRFNQFQDRIAQSFHRGLRSQVDDWLNGEPVSLPEPIKPDNASLALVEKNEFEDWLLVKVIINKADHHYRQTLYDLQKRMSEMSGSEINYTNNPIAPAYISHAFYRAISPLRLPRHIMQLVLSTFQSLVIVDGLNKLYSTLNQFFIDNDILPIIIYKAIISEQSAEPPAEEKTRSATNTVTPITEKSHPKAHTAELSAIQAETADKNFPKEPITPLSAVQKLISLKHETQTTNIEHTPQQAEPRELIETNQFLAQLNQLQQQSLVGTGESPLPLREQITQWCGDNRELSEQDHSAVEMTEQFFVSMANNRHLSNEIKPVLKYLEVPLLKVFIQNDNFFEDANHPARQVLNRLARLGLHGNHLSAKNSKLVEQTLKKISEQFDNDPAVFNTASADLDELITRQEATTQRNTERLVKSCDGLETIEKAKYTIRRFIEEHLSGKLVLKVLVDLMNQGWRELLVFTLLRDGQDSAIWNSYASIVRALSKIEPTSDITALHQMGAGFLKIIDIGIKEAPGGQTQMKKLLPALTALLTPVENTPAPEFIEADSLLTPPDDAFSYIDDEAVQNKALSRWVRRARNLQLGAWVEYGEGKETTQMSLAWIGQDHHKFVFVNHQGMKVIELSLREMAEHLQSGHAKRIDNPDQPFVDQNLDNMVQDMYNQMSYQATHDDLTGLINRKEFERCLELTLAEAKKNQSKHVACHMDLDQFKVINTSCGHDAGNQLLKQVAELLSSRLEKPNHLARSAGDEFLWVLNDTDIQSAEHFASDIKDAVQNLRFEWDNKTYTVGASIGLVSIDEASENPAAVLNAADSARLSAKEAGRNKVYIYKPNDRDLAIRTEIMNNIAQLNKALDEERLKLRCQKISPIGDTSAKPHYEILLSVEDSLGIHLAPGEFIYAAERYNRMQAVDRWVIHNVFKWAKENCARLEQIDCCTINLSGHSLNDETLMEYILDELLAFEIPRDKICFEVTEMAAVTNLTDALEVITELKDLGFKFALDDFGAGLSSFTYLKQIPVDYLKIDGTFIKGIAENPHELAIVRSINEMAHLMGKQTIAEYVESPAIKEKLIEIGVDYAQGYHIEKPISLENLFSPRAVANC